MAIDTQRDYVLKHYKQLPVREQRWIMAKIRLNLLKQWLKKLIKSI